MPTDSMVVRWMERSVNLFDVCFGPDFQVRKNNGEETVSVASLYLKWAVKLSLKGHVDVENALFIFVIYCRPTVSLPLFAVERSAAFALPFRVEGIGTTFQTLHLLQHPMRGGLDMPWLKMRRYVLRVKQLQR